MSVQSASPSPVLTAATAALLDGRPDMTRSPRGREAILTDGHIVCVHCGGLSTARRHDCPWCQPCGCYLTLDAAAGEWVSFAEKLWRDNETDRLPRRRD